MFLEPFICIFIVASLRLLTGKISCYVKSSIYKIKKKTFSYKQTITEAQYNTSGFTYLKILQSLLDFLVLTLAEAPLGTYWPWGIV